MFEFLKGKHGGEGKFVEVDDGGNLLTARYVPDYAQLVALGLVWGAQETSATASVVAKPTTTAAAALYNDNEPDSQIDLVVFGLTATAPASAAQLAMAGLVYVVQKEKPSTKPINDITVRSPMNSPNKNYGGASIFDIAATVVDDGWFPLGDTEQITIASETGMQFDKRFHTPLVLAPGGSVGMDMVSSDTGITFVGGFIFAELRLPRIKL